MAVTAAMVKELRKRTGAGMMECKKALEETNGDMEAAIEYMRKHGQAKAAKRAGRIAAEGIICMAGSEDNKQAFIAEINTETDFVARETSFREFANNVARQGLENQISEIQNLLELPIEKSSTTTIEETRQNLVAKIGENINLRRVAFLESSGIVGQYNHGNRIGVLVALDKALPDVAKDIAMHIAASNPQAIHQDELPKSLVDKEREILKAQAKDSGKPDNIIDKMVEGRLVKFLKEICLVDQPFVKNPDITVSQLLKENHANVLAYVRFEVGEGIEQDSVDFAEEVKAQIQGS